MSLIRRARPLPQLFFQSSVSDCPADQLALPPSSVLWLRVLPAQRVRLQFAEHCSPSLQPPACAAADSCGHSPPLPAQFRLVRPDYRCLPVVELVCVPSLRTPLMFRVQPLGCRLRNLIKLKLEL